MKMNDQTELLAALDAALGKVVAAGLNGIAASQPGAAQRIGESLMQNEVIIRTVCEQQPLHVQVEIVRRDGATDPITIFETCLTEASVASDVH